MPTTIVDVREMQARLTELISLVSTGTEVILTDGNTPLARVVPFTSGITRRVAGLHAGAIQTSEDFDSPLPDELWINEK